MKTLLFNPFIKIAGAKALGIGLIFIIISSILAYLFQTHFDGVLDAHFGEITQWWIPLAENGINILSVFVILYPMAALLTKGRIRWIDILGTTVLARFPLILMPLGNIGSTMQHMGEEFLKNKGEMPEFNFSTGQLIFIIVFTIFSIALLVWYVALLFKAYKVSSNLKQGKLIISFIAGLLLAEIISKILIHQLLN